MARFWSWIKDHRTQAAIGVICTVLALIVAVLALVRDLCDCTFLPTATPSLRPAPPPAEGIQPDKREVNVSGSKFFDFDAPGWPQTGTTNGPAADFVFQPVSTQRYAMVQAAFRVAAAGSGSGLLKLNDKDFSFGGITENDCSSRRSAFGDHAEEDGLIPPGTSLYCVGAAEGHFGKVMIEAGTQPKALVVAVSMWNTN